MVKSFALSVAFFMGTLANAPGARAGGQDKVEICHIPPGNPANAHTIVVDDSAVPAHLAHGDYLGECGGGPGAPTGL